MNYFWYWLTRIVLDEGPLIGLLSLLFRDSDAGSLYGTSSLMVQGYCTLLPLLHV